MKKRFKLLKIAVLSILLFSCNISPLTYEYFKDYQITFQKIFLDTKDHWIYFYDEKCLHCQKIEQKVLSFFKGTIDSFYLVNEVPMENINIHYQESIGATRSEDVLIPGFPTLIWIENQTLTQFYAGKTEIEKYINQAK